MQSQSAGSRTNTWDEAAIQDTFSLALHNLDDDTDITVAVSSSDTGEGTVSPETLTFTEDNWETPQTVTVTGVDDNDADGHQHYDISLSELVVPSKALDFDGVNDYVTTPIDADLQAMPSTTWSGWIKPTGASGWQVIFGMEDGGWDRMLIIELSLIHI